MKTKIKIKLFLVRLSTAWMILTKPHLHWIVFHFTTAELIEQLKGELFEYKLIIHKLQEYNAKAIIKSISGKIDDIELMLEKAQFEAEAELKYGKTNNN